MWNLKTCLATAVLLATSGAATPAAAQLLYSASLGVAYSDNIALTNDADRTGQAVWIPGLAFSWNRQGASLQADVLGSVEYHAYPASRFKNQTFTTLSGQAFWSLSPQRFGISVEDYASVQPVNTLASDAPGNQQQVNVFAVAPVLRFRTGKQMQGRLTLRHAISRAAESRAFNSNRTRLAMQLTRDLSATSQLSFNGAVGEVDIDRDDVAPDYRRQDVFLRYRSQRARLDLSMALGASRIHFDRDNVASQSGLLARLGVDWHASARSTISLDGRRELGDATENMLLGPLGSGMANNQGITTGSAIVNGQVFVERTVAAAYAYQGSRFSFRVAPRYRKATYVNDHSLDRSGRGGYLTLGLRLSPTLVLAASTQWQQFDYDTLARRDRHSRSTLGLRYQRNRHWSWQVRLSYRQRSSDVVNAGYHETRLYCGVTYQR